MCVRAQYVCVCLQELQRETNTVLAEVENWAEQDWEGRGWAGLGAVLEKLPPVRDKLRNMTHCLSDCWTQMDTTLRLLSTLTEVRNRGLGLPGPRAGDTAPAALLRFCSCFWMVGDGRTAI